MDPIFGNGLDLFRLRDRWSGGGGGLVSERKPNTNPHHLFIKKTTNNKRFLPPLAQANISTVMGRAHLLPKLKTISTVSIWKSFVIVG